MRACCWRRSPDWRHPHETTCSTKTLVYARQTGEAVGFANLETGKEGTQVKLTAPPVSLTFQRTT